MHVWSITRPTRKKNTVITYRYVLERFKREFGTKRIDTITSEEIFSFLAILTDGKKQSTKYTWCAVLRAFFNHIIHRYHLSFQNPCESRMIRQVFRPPRVGAFAIIDRETVDEIIYTTKDLRNRLLLELQARGGMRIGEVLKVTPGDIEGIRITLWNPKSGYEQEAVFIPKRVSERLRTYIREEGIRPDGRIFPLTYGGARFVVKRAGERLGCRLRPHDLRRYSATYASRSGVPLEVVSKVILRHKNLSTTQRYLGKVSEAEAARWIDRIYE
jgi:integrase